MGALALVAVGCGSAGNTAGSGNVAPPAAPVAPVHSSLKRGVVFGLASNDGQKSIDIPIGTSPEIRAAQAKILSKVQTSPQFLRRELNTPSALEQRLASSDLGFSTFTTSRLKGPEPSIAYKQASSQAAHNGITFSCSPMFAAGSHTLTAKFDFPGTGPLGVFPYLQVGDLFQYSSPNNRGAAASTQSGVTFGMTTSVNGDGTGTQEITMEGGILYSGPLLNIVPWISSFQSGLHHAKVTIDGETVVDEDFIQRGLLFKDRLPEITAGQPDNIAVNTSFGWTEDDATIDDTIAVDSPRWRAALGNNTVQAAGSLSNSAWHDGNAVSFTINNLRETLTKNLQPLTQVPIDPRAKTYESNKTLNYAVQAQALASFRYFGMTDFGQVPGFRRDVILSNFQQTPLQAKPGTPVVFEFDINAINFESGTPYVNFGLAEDPQTSEYAFFSHGELSEIDTGWHVRVPWTATQLSPPTGFLTVSVAETSDPGKSAFAEQEFQVSLDQQQSDRTAKVEILDVNPNPIKVEESTDVTVHGRVSSTGMTNPSYNWTVSFYDDDGNLLNLVSGETADIAVTQTFSPLSFSTTSELTVHIDGTVYDKDHLERGPLEFATVSLSGGGTGGGTVGGGGSGSGTGSSNDVTVEVDNATKLTVHDSKSNKDVGLAFHADRTKDSTDQKVERRKLLRNIVPDNTSDWELRVDGLQFTDSDPAKIPAKVKAEVRSTISKAVMEVNLLREGQTLTFKSGKIGTPKDGKKLIKLDPPPGDSVPNANLTYAVVEAFAVDPIAQDLATKVMGFTEKIFPFPAVSLGTLSIEAAYADDSKPESATDDTDNNIEKVVPTIGSDGNDNFSAAGFEAVRIQITDPSVKDESKLTAVVKVAHGSEEYIVNLHGDHHGDLLLKEKETDLANYNVGQARMSEAIQTLFLVACDALDLHDYNGFYTYPHFPKDLDPELGYPADSGMAYSFKDLPGVPRTFGGRRWLQATSGNTDVLLGYAGPAPILSFRDVNTRFEYELRQTGLPRTDQRVLAWLRANRAVARQDFPGKGWLCLNACAWDKRAGKYYYIPYVPPGGVYYDPASLSRPGRLKILPPAAVVGTGREMIEEFGIYEVPMNSDAVPAPDPRTGWQIPPETIGSRIEK